MASQDYGILITQPGVDASGASANQVLMNTSHPFIKLDTQVPTSFQTITLLITTDPPEPVSPATDTYTVVYKFKHSYKYIPCLETLFFVSSPAPSVSYYDQYYLDRGVLNSHGALDSGDLYAVADTTWVYFIVHKHKDISGNGSSNLLTGTVVQITPHVFVESTS